MTESGRLTDIVSSVSPRIPATEAQGFLTHQFSRIVRKIWQPILFGTLATVVFFLVGAFLSGGGHNLALMMVFFPWAMTLASLSPAFDWQIPFFLLMALQFPGYGFALNAGRGRRSLFWGTAGAVALVHVLGVIWCFVFDPRESWRIFF